MRGGEDGLEGEDECGVGGRKQLLGPALDGEGGSSVGEQRPGDGQSEDASRGEVERQGRPPRQGREQHEDGGEGDLEGAEAARGELRGGIREGE